MGTILYSINGEGRGHATRASAIIDGLRNRHRIIVFTHALALKLLRQKYAGTDVEIREIPGCEFRYTPQGKLDYRRSFFESGLPLLRQRKVLAEQWADRIAKDDADLLVTDFEPLLAASAERIGLPYISVDHQHFLATGDFAGLPWEMRAYIWFMRPWIDVFYRGQMETVVSSFFSPGVHKNRPDVRHIGVLLRDEVLNTVPEHGDHVVAYFRRHAAPRVLDALNESGREVRVYGLGERESRGNLRFCPTSMDGFLADFATAACLVSTAGNQLIGEAIHLRKPVLAMPEPGNFEQRLNAWYIGNRPWGRSTTFAAIDGRMVRSFAADSDDYRRSMDAELPAGNFEAISRVEACLRAVAPQRLPAPVAFEETARSA
jgi:uncharacterized protein (TIGR00661 family)